MKKITKTTTSRAPATKPAATAPASEPKTISAPRVLKPIKLVAAVSPSATVIAAKVDVGFGNTLFVRGEGPGLGWEKGVALENIGSGEWTLTLRGVRQPVILKLLINDEQWSTGENYTAAPGVRTTITPVF